MKTKNIIATAAVMLSVGIFTSCEKENNDKELPSGEYVIVASSDEATYLLQTNDLTSGSQTIKYHGNETDNGTAWLFYKNKYAYRLVYNQGNAGTGSSYYLNQQGVVEERSILFQIKNRFTTYGFYGQHLITAASGATADKDEATDQIKYGVTFTYLDVEKQTLDTKTIVTENMVDDNGEYYTVSGIVEHNGKIYTALCPQGYSTYGVQRDGGSYITGSEDLIDSEAGTIKTTTHPDNVWVAIYNGIDFENPTIIKDDRISFATSRFKSQFYQMLHADDDGNIYVFSASNAQGNEDARQKTVLPSGVIRIKAGETDFDQGYYANIEELSGGCRVFRVWHISQDYFLFQMYAEPGTAGANLSDLRRLAIFKAGEKTFTWVDSGLPEKSTISSFGTNPFFEDGLAYMPVVTDGGAQPTVYIIDPATATAQKGIEVICSSISAIGRLKK